LKWTGHAPQGEGRGARHARHTAKGSIELVRRFRAVNPNLAGIMPFESPFYYCGDNVTAFADLPTVDPARGLYGGSAVLLQEATSFTPLLLSIELWTPHRYSAAPVLGAGAGAESTRLNFTVHIVNDQNDGAALAPATLRWHVCDEKKKNVGSAKTPAVPYYHTTAVTAAVVLAGCAEGVHNLTVELLSAAGAVLASNIEPISVYAPAPKKVASNNAAEPAAADTALLLYESGGKTATAAMLRAAGAAVRLVTSTELAAAISKKKGASAGAVVIVGEDSWDASIVALSAELGSYAAAGRVVVLQQSQASVNFSLGWAPHGDALVPYPDTQYIMHSGLTVGRGQPVHPTRERHPLFEQPHALSREDFLVWNDHTGWAERNFLVVEGPLPEGKTAKAEQAPIPILSPRSMGFMLNSTNATAEISKNEAALAGIDVLIGHAMGLQDIVVAELAGARGGGVVFCGLGLVARRGSDPVADRFAANLLAFAAAPAATRPQHPLVPAGHTVEWGVYSTELGLVRSDTNGLILQACDFNPGCSMANLGGVACGRNVFGPFTWSYMGHNLDLQPDSAAGKGVVWLRTNATSAATTFAVPPLPSHHHGIKPVPKAAAPPVMTVELLAVATDSGQLQQQPQQPTKKCDTTKDGDSWVVVCKLFAGGGGGTGAAAAATIATDHDEDVALALRFEADKTLTLVSTAFL
jgi:hypothetical protein